MKQVESIGTPGVLGHRLIIASRRLDRIYARFDRLRATAILAFASDVALDRFNQHIYRESSRYSPDSEGYVKDLYPWEESAIREHFPRPPAHLLVGGAGAGREPLALTTLGYTVTAFEPVKELVASMERIARERGVGVASYVGSYQDLPLLARTGDGTREKVASMGPFDGAIIGWGSFSHIRSETLRIHTLLQMSSATRGPVLVSFISTRPEGPPGAGRLRTRLLARRQRHPADRFSMSMGFHHPVNQEEVRLLASRAGLEVVAIDFSGSTLAPYAVLRHQDR